MITNDFWQMTTRSQELCLNSGQCMLSKKCCQSTEDLFTWNNTNLKNVRVNDFVNVEIDLLSRYLVNYQKKKEN